MSKMARQQPPFCNQNALQNSTTRLVQIKTKYKRQFHKDTTKHFTKHTIHCKERGEKGQYKQKTKNVDQWYQHLI